MKQLTILVFTIILAIQAPGSAQDLFSITVDAQGLTSFTEEFDNASDLINAFDGNFIEDRIPGFNDNAIATGTLGFRGVDVILAFETAGTALRLRIPETGLDVTFTGATRDASENLLEDFFESEGEAEITKLLQALARKTTSDPIAGNPNSLISTAVYNDFNSAFVPEDPQPPRKEKSKKEARNDISVGAVYSILNRSGADNEKITIPLGYTYRSKTNPRRKYKFKLPISRMEISNSIAYHVSPSIAVSLPVNKFWTMTPSLGYGLSGSDDFGTGTQLVTGSLTNAFKFELWGLRHTYGNMVGYYDSLKLSIGDFSIDPDITIIPFVNGFQTQIPTENFIKGSSIRLYIIDTNYFGDDVAVEHSDEFGLALTVWRGATIGVNYLYSSEIKGVRFGFNFRF